jgi:hypothetical protein
MEEEEEGGYPSKKLPIGFAGSRAGDGDSREDAAGSILPEILRSLIEERQIILAPGKTSSRDKLKLLEQNRKAIIIATGGRVNTTENVVYGILIFGAVVLVILSLLTAFAKLPSEVTISFVGTVLGGTIATIAQKLGKLENRRTEVHPSSYRSGELMSDSDH